MTDQFGMVLQYFPESNLEEIWYVWTKVLTVIRTLQNGSVSALGRFNLSGAG